MSALKLIPRKQPNSEEVIRSFESETAEVIGKHHLGTKRSVLYVLVAMLGSIGVFISVTHLDRVVTATGRLVPVGGALTVQPLEKAIITRILVSVGDTVKKGQVLATLDPTFVQADFDQVQQKVASLSPKQRRMEAEEAGQPFLAEPSRPYDLLQDSIRKERQTEYDAGILDFDQRIRSGEAQVVGLRRSIDDYHARLKIAVETEHMYTEMLDAGVASRLQLIGVQDTRLELERKLAEEENTLDSTDHAIESLKQQREVYIHKWHDENLNELEKVRNDLDEAHDDRIKAKKKSELTNLVAPVDAVVLKTPVINLGGVVMDAEPMFSLMPVDAQVQVDAQIDAKDSGFVKVGDPVRIKFEAYKYLEHGIAEGVVKTISQDSFTQVSGQDAVTAAVKEGNGGDTRTPYFDVRINITALKLHDVPANVRLIPGMTLEADIIVGRRTILWYLLGGALRSGSEAMREP